MSDPALRRQLSIARAALRAIQAFPLQSDGVYPVFSPCSLAAIALRDMDAIATTPDHPAGHCPHCDAGLPVTSFNKRRQHTLANGDEVNCHKDRGGE